MDMISYLDQGEVWIGKDGQETPIVDMSPLWRTNAARWLLRHAPELRTEYRITQLRHDLIDLDEATGPIDWDARAFLIEDQAELVEVLRQISKPDEWVRETALYRALTTEHHVPVDVIRPEPETARA